MAHTVGHRDYRAEEGAEVSFQAFSWFQTAVGEWSASAYGFLYSHAEGDFEERMHLTC